MSNQVLSIGLYMLSQLLFSKNYENFIEIIVIIDMTIINMNSNPPYVGL